MIVTAPPKYDFTIKVFSHMLLANTSSFLAFSALLWRSRTCCLMLISSRYWCQSHQHIYPLSNKCNHRSLDFGRCLHLWAPCILGKRSCTVPLLCWKNPCLFKSLLIHLWTCIEDLSNCLIGWGLGYIFCVTNLVNHIWYLVEHF